MRFTVEFGEDEAGQPQVTTWLVDAENGLDEGHRLLYRHGDDEQIAELVRTSVRVLLYWRQHKLAKRLKELR